MGERARFDLACRARLAKLCTRVRRGRVLLLGELRGGWHSSGGRADVACAQAARGIRVDRPVEQGRDFQLDLGDDMFHIAVCKTLLLVAGVVAGQRPLQGRLPLPYLLSRTGVAVAENLRARAQIRASVQQLCTGDTKAAKIGRVDLRVTGVIMPTARIEPGDRIAGLLLSGGLTFQAVPAVYVDRERVVMRLGADEVRDRKGVHVRRTRASQLQYLRRQGWLRPPRKGKRHDWHESECGVFIHTSS